MLIIAGGILIAVAALVALAGFVFLAALVVARCSEDGDFMMKVVLFAAVALAVAIGQVSPALAWLFVLACSLFVGGIVVAAGVHEYGRAFPGMLRNRERAAWVAVPVVVSIYAACALWQWGV